MRVVALADCRPVRPFRGTVSRLTASGVRLAILRSIDGGAKPMTSQLPQPDEIMDQPEVAVCSSRLGAALAGWCVLASALLLFVVF